MGKKNSKLKQDTIDRLTSDTYCEYPMVITLFETQFSCRFVNLVYHQCWREKKLHRIQFSSIFRSLKICRFESLETVMHIYIVVLFFTIRLEKYQFLNIRKNLKEFSKQWSMKSQLLLNEIIGLFKGNIHRSRSLTDLYPIRVYFICESQINGSKTTRGIKRCCPTTRTIA